MSLPGSGEPSDLERKPACQMSRPASTDGTASQNSAILVLYYYGTAAYEVDYYGKLFLIDPHCDGSREPDVRKIGLRAADITQADSLLVGHSHFDHIVGASAVSKRTGALIFVGRAGEEILQKPGITQDHDRIVSGGEDIKMDGFRILTGLARHSAAEPSSLLSPETGPPFKQLTKQRLTPVSKRGSSGNTLETGWGPCPRMSSLAERSLTSSYSTTGSR
jgi:hypothetical protein